ncbi:bifunctional serine/threonine-protein kinase/ABC transporter substrate-binding protein [Nocardia sp. NPDC050406]|uniref:bifunctional serine/threonine-protein kinase/ABC transporter substrate-binding protein n=1 Tax=Nocardia sp. NPDC050406 TaxID=3364318 RepID=UPI0037ADACD3
MLRVGEEFAGYVIERQIGRGGMGEMYLARHPRLPRSIAVKVLRRDFAEDGEIRARFEREADLVARLDHPNVVSVYDRGVDGGRLWIAMQYVDGVDVSTLDPARLAPQRAVFIVGETAKALDYAHEVGVLHRDVKPANIMLARPSPGHGERVLLTDFGIGRLRDDTKNLTRTGTLTATMAYASPEQLSGQGLDHRSDQYSLACTLFWLLTGTTPFESDDVVAVIAGHLHQPPPSVSARRPILPSALDAVLARALAKRPDDRFRTCADFAAAALRAVQDATVTAPSSIVAPIPVTQPDIAATAGPPSSRTTIVDAVPPPSTGPAAGASAVESREDSGSGGRRTRWLVTAAIGLVVVLAVTVGIVWATRDSGSEGTDTASGGSAVAVDTHVALFPNLQPLGPIDEQGAQVAPPAAALDPAGDGAATCAPLTIAMTGPLSGDNAALGGPVLGGVSMAVQQFTAKNPGCPVTVQEFDSAADPRTATEVASRLVADESVVALIGPVFSGEVRAAGQIYSDAGLPFLTPAAGSPTLATLGWRGFFRGLPNDDLQGPAVGRHLAAGYGRVCVVADGSDYGAALARGVTSGLGRVAAPECAETLAPGADFAATVSRIAAAAPDAVFYAGYATEAAALLQRLRDAGVSATFVTGDGGYLADLVSGADSAANGAIVSCPCGPPTDRFVADYQTATGGVPDRYSVEAYDLTAIVLRGIASGRTTRAELTSYLQEYRGAGVAREYQWTNSGELVEPRIWLYQVS